MAFPPLHAVHSKFRVLAFAVVGIWAIAVVSSLTVSLLNIWQRREHPPTEIEIFDVYDGHWGTMPMFAFYKGQGSTRGWSSTDRVYLDPYLPGPIRQDIKPRTFQKDPENAPDPYSFSLRGEGRRLDTLVINASMLRPNFTEFGDNYTTVPIFAFKLPFQENDNAFMHIVDADTTRGWLNHHHFSKQSSLHSHFKMVMTFRRTNNQCVSLLYLKKSFIPKAGVFWGFPWEGEHIKPAYELTGPFCRQLHSPHPWGRAFEIYVTQATIEYVKPISLMKQAYRVFTNAGGSVALLSTLFFFVFTRRFPPTEEEAESVELTVRGFQARSRIATEEWRAEESQNQLLPSTFQEVFSRSTSTLDAPLLSRTTVDAQCVAAA